MSEKSPLPRVSVCIAAYNGAAYITEQLQSILAQLDDTDEVIVLNDASTDHTADVVKGIKDSRIRLIDAPKNRGYVRTFEAALGEARGKYIFLSDQDDIWVPGRVDSMIDALKERDLVVSNFSTFGGEASEIAQRKLRAKDENHSWRNIFWVWVGTRPYYGCCMAMTAELKDYVLPFPPALTETHDQWIGFVGNALGSVRHLEQNTVTRRIHDGNVTPKNMRSVRRIISARIMTARAIAEAFRRRSRGRR